MHNPDELRRVVVIYPRPEDFREYLATRFPDIHFCYAVDFEEVGKQLTENEPEAIFSIKMPELSPPAHHEAANFPSVRWVHVGGSGYEHLGSWDRDRTVVTHSAGVLAPYLAETVIGAMLALNGNFLAYAEQQNRREWSPLPFRPLAGQVLLVIGLGEIGGHVAAKAKALGMHVIGIRRSQTYHPAVDEVYPPAVLVEVLPRADFVSLHLRLDETTRRLMNAETFSAMKPSAIFINTSRGAVVDESALTKALAGERLAGAYLDVFEEEPLSKTSALWGMKNVLITPHAAENITDWPQRLAEFFGDNLDRWRTDSHLRNRVNALAV